MDKNINRIIIGLVLVLVLLVGVLVGHWINSKPVVYEA